MDKIINQFRRIYSDNGSGDRDFSKQEAKLRQSREYLTSATQALVKSSERLNAAALAAYGPDTDIKH